MAKRGENMSLAVDPEFQDVLKKAAAKRGISTSKLIRDVMQKYLPAGDEEVDTIFFKIPSSMKNDKEALRSWMSKRVDLLVEKLSSLGSM